MKKVYGTAVLLCLGLIAGPVLAESIPFKKYRLLHKGMSAGEVLYLAGEPDLKQLRDIHWTNMQSWFYIPAKDERQKWQTVIHFDAYGYVKRIDRDKILFD